MLIIPQASSLDLTAGLSERFRSGVNRGAAAAIPPADPLLERDAAPDTFDPSTIPLHQGFVSGHILEAVINKETPLETEDILNVLSKLHFQIPFLTHGTIPAASNEATSYSRHAWTRDTAIVALALEASGYTLEAGKALSNLSEFYARDEERNRFLVFHFSPHPEEAYRPSNCLVLPHVRAHIDEGGRLTECDEDWGHNQLDALGMWLAATFRMANAGSLDLETLDRRISADINPKNGIESIFAVALKSLYRMKFWDQSDKGPWEEFDAHQRASSVGACISAFVEARRYFEQHPQALAVSQGSSEASMTSMLEEGIEKGRTVLSRRLLGPQGAIESEAVQADASLVFLLHPFNPGLSRAEELAILKTLYDKRMGEVGFTRRDGDAYVGMDYAHQSSPNLRGIFSDLSSPNHRAAEWTLFDPLLAAYFYNRFIESQGKDFYAYMLADRHLKRSLSFITKENESYRKAFNDTEIKVPEGRVPEAFWFDSQSGKWRANENSPLLMAEAAYALMFERGVQASDLLALRRSIRGSNEASRN